MLILINLLFVLIVSLVIGAMFSLVLRGRSQRVGTLWFFLILFLGTWALGTWMRPIGPPAWDVYWVPYVLAAAVIALVLAAATPVQADRSRPPSASGGGPHDSMPAETREQAARAVETLSIFFWLLLGISILAIVLHYVPQWQA